MFPAIKDYLKEKDAFKETLASNRRSDGNTAEAQAAIDKMAKRMEEHQSICSPAACMD